MTQLPASDALDIYMIGGLSDFDVAGNQSSRKSVEFLQRLGHRIEYWSFFPEGFDNVREASDIAPPPFRIHRLPSGFLPLFRLAKLGKNRFGRHRSHGVAPAKSVSYHDDYNRFGRLMYVVALFAVVVPLDLLRVGLRCVRKRPDLFYGVNAQGAIVASLLGRMFQRPVVTRFHGTSITQADLRQRALRFRLADEVRALAARADAVIMTNDGTRGDKVLAQLGVPGDRIHFWLNGVDPAALAGTGGASGIRSQLGLNQEKIVLTVSRLAKWKRVDRVIHAVARLPASVANSVCLVVIGDGPDRAGLEKLASELGVEPRVRFVGAVDHRRVPDFFQIADVFVSAYDVSNLGNPLLEAIYFRVPIVTLDDGSVDGVLVDGLNALLVAPADAESGLPQAIGRLIEDQNLARRVREGLAEVKRSALWSWEERIRIESELLVKVARG